MSRRSDYGDDRRRERSPSSESSGSRAGRGPFRGYRDAQYAPPSHSGYSHSSYSQSQSTSTRSDYSDLPSHVPVPETGKGLGLQTLAPQGRDGRPMTVLINHFPVQSLCRGTVYQYKISFHLAPGSERKGSDKVTAYNIARTMTNAANFKLIPSDFIFDGVSRGWSIDNMFEGKPPGAISSSKIDLGGNNMHVIIDMVCEGPLNLSRLVQDVTNGTRPTTAAEDCIKYLTSAFRQEPAKEFITRPNSSAFFMRTPELCKSLESTGGVLEALRGMHQAVSVNFGRLTINVDTCCSAFYAPDRCLLDVAKTYNGLRSSDNIRNIDQFVESCQKLIGIYFVVKHLDLAKKSIPIRVQSISPQDAYNTTFQYSRDREGKSPITYTIAGYFRSKYRIDLRHAELPLVVTRKGVFPLELCYTASGERYKEALQGKETSDFIRFATSPAFIRSKQIMSNVKLLEWNQQTHLSTHGISVQPRMLEVPARRLPAPIPTYQGAQDSSAPDSGSWNLKGKKFIRARRFQAWGVVYFVGRKEVPDAQLQDFLQNMTRVFQSQGMGVPSSAPVFRRGNAQGDIAKICREIFDRASDYFKVQMPDVLFFFLHDTMNPGIYKIIKKTCETELGVPSQCMIVEKSVHGRGDPRQYCANVAMKVNLKLGGLNSEVVDRFFREKKVLNIGADVTHPSPAERRRNPPPPSFACMTGSDDQPGCHYTALVCAQESGKETIKALSVMFKEMLKRFRQKAKSYPDVVLFWRDGLSVGETSNFVDTELAALKSVRGELGANFKIVTLIAVKRHHTRLFPTSKQEGDKNGNLLPGVLVESTVGPKFEFFLVTASALQGTIAPVNYKLVEDEGVGLSIDDVGRLIMNSCFSYGRATRSVSVHPAIYYAHQAANRARMWLTPGSLPQIHDNLKETMFWQ